MWSKWPKVLWQPPAMKHTNYWRNWKRDRNLWLLPVALLISNWLRNIFRIWNLTFLPPDHRCTTPHGLPKRSIRMLRLCLSALVWLNAKKYVATKQWIIFWRLKKSVRFSTDWVLNWNRYRSSLYYIRLFAKHMDLHRQVVWWELSKLIWKKKRIKSMQYKCRTSIKRISLCWVPAPRQERLRGSLLK